LSLEGAPRQAFGNPHRLVAADRLRTSELNEKGRIRLKCHRGDQRSDIVGTHPTLLRIPLPNDGDLPVRHVEATDRGQMNLLKGVRSNDHSAHERPLQPLLGGQFGALNRHAESSVDPRIRQVDEPFDTSLFGGVDKCRHAELIHLMDRRATRASQASGDHCGRRHDGTDALAGLRQARRFDEVAANDVSTLPRERRLVGPRTYQAADLGPTGAQNSDDPTPQLTRPADNQDHQNLLSQRPGLASAYAWGMAGADSCLCGCDLHALASGGSGSMINDSALYDPWMAKLIYSALTSLDGYVSDEDATSTGPLPARRCMPSPMILSDRSGRTCTGGGCTRRWSTGKRRTPCRSHRPSNSTMRKSGSRRKRSSTRRPWTRSLVLVPGSSGISTRTPSGNSHKVRPGTSAWEGLSSPPRPSRPASSTSITCSSIPSWSGAAPPHCRTTSALTSNWSMNIVSQTASSTFTIESPPPSLSLAEFAAQRRTMSLPSSALCGKTQPDLTEIPSICGLVRKDAARPGRNPVHLRPCAERRSPT